MAAHLSVRLLDVVIRAVLRDLQNLVVVGGALNPRDHGDHLGSGLSLERKSYLEYRDQVTSETVSSSLGVRAFGRCWRVRACDVSLM
jgi:hypothetical protein